TWDKRSDTVKLSGQTIVVETFFKKTHPSMDDIRHSLIYDRGYVAMTDTHLLVVEDSVVAEFLAFEHLAKVSTEEAHSFRHRIIAFSLGCLPFAADLLDACALCKRN